MSDTHSNAPEKLSDLKLEHLSDFDWNRCPTWIRTGVRHELESLSDLACSTHLDKSRDGRCCLRPNMPQCNSGLQADKQIIVFERSNQGRHCVFGSRAKVNQIPRCGSP